MNYKVCISNPTDHFAGFTAFIPHDGCEFLDLQLPAWRPGRYELGNFAKNILGFLVLDNDKNPIPFKKMVKDCWRVFARDLRQIEIRYTYYSHQADAGACWVKEDLLYLNPVHCFFYVPGREEEPIRVELDIPDNWQIASQLLLEGKTLVARDFDQLADSPFFAAPDLVHHEFSFRNSTIHFWFKGGVPESLQRLENDTLRYAEAQTRIFGEFPPVNYHFLYLLLSDKFRHGVEHFDSTVIAMGPAADLVQEAFYNDLLAISSHELFHLWNVKRMRPAEMLPYDFTRENYSELGYIYEGVTTYYGDLMLLRCGVWDFETYSASLALHLDKHFNNPGRLNYSVAQSSFDTWLDGYVPGVKGRKVSIYTEGLVAALVADVQLLKFTEGKKRLDQVLGGLYQKTWKTGSGYTELLYKVELEAVSGANFTGYFEDLIHGSGKWDGWIEESFALLGLLINKDLQEDGSIKTRIVKFPEVSVEQQAFFENWTKSS